MITQFVREIFLVDDLIITIEVHYQKCYHLGLLKKGYAIRDVAKLMGKGISTIH